MEKYEKHNLFKADCCFASNPEHTHLHTSWRTGQFLGSDERMTLVRSSRNCNGCGACSGSKQSVCKALKMGPKKLEQAESRKKLLLRGETDLALENCLSSKSSMVSEEHRRHVETFFTSEEVSRVCPNISESILVLGGRRIRRTKKNAAQVVVPKAALDELNKRNLIQLHLTA